jgi:hypothetical protein
MYYELHTFDNQSQCIAAAATNTTTIQQNTTQCHNLWWFDLSNQSCSATKQFCGAYMYYGLHTFGNQSDCVSAAATNTTTIQQNTTQCHTLWWFDLSNQSCSATRQFCGAYMYYGLHTFGNQSECVSAAATNLTTVTTTISQNSTMCNDLWWLDSSNHSCSATRQFCGEYMYYGLHTFNNQSACVAAIPQVPAGIWQNIETAVSAFIKYLSRLL